eukprot:s1953_g11.t1
MSEERFEAAWAAVSATFDLNKIFGSSGANFLETLGAKRCIHPFAAGMSILASLASLANGASVRIWSDPTPLCIAAVLVNGAQTRKSQTTAIVHELGLVLDRTAHEREREEMKKHLPKDADPVDVLHEQLPSAVLEGFTPEAASSMLCLQPFFDLLVI